MDFLDVLLSMDDDGFISSNLFRKSTATNILLHATSSQPKPLIHNLPVGQFLCLKIICSKEEFFEQKSTELHLRFRERGYPTHSINRAYWRAKQSQHKELMKGHIKKETHHQIRFIAQYHSRWREMKSALDKYWDILLADNVLNDHSTTSPSITYRRSQNLCDILVHSHHTG